MTRTPLSAALAAITRAEGESPSPALELIGAKCAALAVGYDLCHKDADYVPLHVERTITAPLINPDTERRSRTFILAGKLDMEGQWLGIRYSECELHSPRNIAQDIIMDAKTTSAAIVDPDGAYWDQLIVEAQVSHYMLLKWLNGEKVDTAVWDVVCKPSISPKKLTLAMQKSVVSSDYRRVFQILRPPRPVV